MARLSAIAIYRKVNINFSSVNKALSQVKPCRYTNYIAVSYTHLPNSGGSAPGIAPISTATGCTRFIGV